MALYGTGIEEYIQALRNHGCGLVQSGDLSMIVAEHLAIAYATARLFAAYGDLEGRPLVLPAIEQAWRELLFVRGRLPEGLRPADPSRRVTLTRYGRIQIQPSLEP